MKRILSVGAALLALASGAACTSDSDGGATAAARKPQVCGDDAYDWTVSESVELTGLADPIHLKRDGQPYTVEFRSVGRSYVGTVTSEYGAGGPKPAEVLKTLGTYIGARSPLPGPGEEPADPDDLMFENSSGDETGHYYAYSYLPLVEADYIYACGEARPVSGHVVTWSLNSGTGVEACADRLKDEEENFDDPELTNVKLDAARASCPPGSPAAEEPEAW